MLVLTRRLYETIRIGDDITITVARIDRGTVRIGIDAPQEIPVQRGELHEAIHEGATAVSDRQEANARLIGAAGDLLEACKAALALLNSDFTSPHFRQSPDPERAAVSVLTVAIAKAEGKPYSPRQGATAVTGPNVSIASDYAVLKAGDLRFYYGYEETVGDAEEGTEEWCFTATVCGKQVAKAPFSLLGAEYESECGGCLLYGIGWYLLKQQGEQP